MREINSDVITQAVKNAYIDLNINVNNKVKTLIEQSEKQESSPLARSILKDMQENFNIAHEKHLPICQDTGMAIIFAKVGQDVHIIGDDFTKAINAGVAQGYIDGYLRKSIVGDPLIRENTKNNTPAVIHTEIVPGESIELTLMAKGFGSENTSALKMLKPSDGIEGVKEFVNKTIQKALPNGCAPLFVGIGVGGDFETCAINAKKALTLPPDYVNSEPIYEKLSEEIKQTANATGYGPMGLGGNTSVLGVNIIQSPTHIAGLPVAVNICCYVDRVSFIKI